MPELALVLPGGGARTAYQVGVLRALARRFPTLDPPILTGVSAGAINCAWLATRPGSFADKVEALAGMWERLSTDEVFRVEHWLLALASVFAGISGANVWLVSSLFA